MTNLRRPKANRQPGIADALHELLVRTTRRVAAGVLSPATLAMQEEHARYLLERLPRALAVDRITAELLEQLVAAEEKGRRVRADGRTRALSGGTVRKRLSTLRQALELQRRKGALATLPVFPEVPYYRPSKSRLPTLQMPAKVYAHAQPVRFREQIARTVAFASGPRRGPLKASRERVGNPQLSTSTEVGPAALAAPPAPNTCPGETGPGAGSERSSQLPTTQATTSHGSSADAVGAAGIEPATNGLRVRVRARPLTKTRSHSVPVSPGLPSSQGETRCEPTTTRSFRHPKKRR